MFKFALLVAGGALFVSLLSLWYASPIFKPFPKPTGQFYVGTTVMEFNDPSRKETYSENPDENTSNCSSFFLPITAKQ